MSIPLDPREVLQTLNSMGYRNISAEQLKEFIKDLKRFIIYENRYSNIEEVFHKIVNKSKNTTVSQELNHFERLHISTTHTSRAKTTPRRSDENIISSSCALTKHCNSKNVQSSHKNQENQTTPKNNTNQIQLKTNSAASVLTETNAKSTRQGVVPIPMHVEPSAPSVASRATSTTSINRGKLIRNTPTDLYHYYQKDWDRFKKYLPGENSRSSVRMEVRKRMDQPLPPKPKVYLSVGENHKKVLTRM